jgi:hypothetical protein
MATYPNLGGMLTQAGQQQGQVLGSAFTGLAQNLMKPVDSMLARKKNEGLQKEVQDFLATNKDDPAALNAEAARYTTMGNDAVAKVFKDAAQAAVDRKAKATGQAQGRGKGELMALANNPEFNFQDPKQQTGYFALADATGVPREEAAKIALDAKKAREGGRVTSSRSGGQYRDEDGNIYEASIVRSSAGEQVRYLPISPGAPKEPVGELTSIGGAYSETASERTARGITEAGSEKTAENWADLKSEAVDKLPRIERSIAKADRSLELIEQINTGGLSTAAVRAVQDVFGVTPANEAEFNLLAGQSVLDGLANFEGAISEGERMYLERLYEDLKKSPEANKAILLQMQRTFKAALRDAQLRANSASEEEYLRKRGSLEAEAPAKKENRKVSWSELKTGG